MSYVITHTDGQSSITIEDGTIDSSSTSLSFVGKQTSGYSRPFAENFLHLLENFACPTPPLAPIVGQLWYDTSDAANFQLNVWDGTGWASASNLFKGVIPPSNASAGDLWLDTSRQQLFFKTGADWILIGPQFSDGLQTGPVSKQIFDVTDAPHNIIELVVGVTGEDLITRQERVAIICFESFIPKSTIPGFTRLEPGINISTIVGGRVWGTASNSLKLDGVELADVLLRTRENTTPFRFNIASNLGLTVGAAGNIQLTNSSTNDAILSNQQSNKSVIIKTVAGSTLVDVAKFSAANSFIASDTVSITGTTTLTGPVSVIDNLTSVIDLSETEVVVGVPLQTNSIDALSIVSGNVVPRSSSVDLGAVGNKWRTVYSADIRADDIHVTGTITGTITGNISGKSAGLITPTAFTITGDVEQTAPVSFVGTGVPINFNVAATPQLFNSRGPVDTSSMLFDEILINRSGAGLKRITKQTFITGIPLVETASIFLYPDTDLPANYVACDGAEYARLLLPKLFARIGTMYGSTSSTTFKVPNYTAPVGAVYVIFTGEV
jgi:hypothetical protein